MIVNFIFVDTHLFCLYFIGIIIMVIVMLPLKTKLKIKRMAIVLIFIYHCPPMHSNIGLGLLLIYFASQNLVFFALSYGCNNNIIRTNFRS